MTVMGKVMIPLIKVGLPPSEVLMPLLEESLYGGNPINEGEKVYEFEAKFKKAFELPDSSLSMSSGTAALHTSLILAGVRPGDEVITTSLTAEPTNLSILHVGATPIFVDVDIGSGNISPESIQRAITPKTKAVIVVHYAGYPAEIVRIAAICKNNGLKLIEDCAHALGARIEGRSVGCFGDYAIFSFQAIKHFTTIDGGFLVCRSQADFLDAKKIRWFGMEKGKNRTSLDVDVVGYKYNYQNVFATIGLCQLDYIMQKVNKHKANGLYYDKVFYDQTGVKPARVEKASEASYWLYTLIFDSSDLAKRVETYLKNNGVDSSKLHKLNHLHSVFKNKRKLDSTEDFYGKMLHIPCGWWVDNDSRKLIADLILEEIGNV